jgi:hypothetical protein
MVSISRTPVPAVLAGSGGIGTSTSMAFKIMTSLSNDFSLVPPGSISPKSCWMAKA